MSRADALVACRIAGYHDDQRAFVRAYTENRISMQAARAEFREIAVALDLGQESIRDTVAEAIALVEEL